MCGSRERGVLQVKVGHWGLLTSEREIFQLPKLPLPLPALWQGTGAWKEAAMQRKFHFTGTWHRVTHKPKTQLCPVNRLGDELTESSP